MSSVLLSPRPATAQFNLGCIIIGTYLNLMLYSVILFAAFIYFKSARSKRDPLFVKIAVGVNVVMDTIGTFGVCGTFFYLTVLRWGNFDFEFRVHWMPVMGFIAGGFSEFVVQGFMCRRYFILSKSYFISAIISTLMLLSLVSTLHLAIASAAGKLPSHHRSSNLTPFIVCLVSTLVCDIATTAAMFWTLKKTNTYTRISHHIVSRISAIVIITGTLNVVCVIATMATFLAYPMSALTSAFNCFLGRTYTATMLFTLLYRDMIAGDRWIQVDDIGEESTLAKSASSGYPSIDESLRSAGISISEMTFARRESVNPSKIPRDVEKLSIV